jgi:hypothetical protein
MYDALTILKLVGREGGWVFYIHYWSTMVHITILISMLSVCRTLDPVGVHLK